MGVGRREAVPNGEGRNGNNARKLTQTGLTSTGATVVGEKNGYSIVAFFEDRLWNLQEVLDLTSQLVELVPGRSSPHKEARRRHRRHKSKGIPLSSCPPSLWPHRSSRSPYRAGRLATQECRYDLNLSPDTAPSARELAYYPPAYLCLRSALNSQMQVQKCNKTSRTPPRLWKIAPLRNTPAKDAFRGCPSSL